MVKHKNGSHESKGKMGSAKHRMPNLSMRTLPQFALMAIRGGVDGASSTVDPSPVPPGPIRG